MRRFCYAVIAVAMTLATGLVAAGSVPAAAADPAFTVTTLHFKVTVGPEGATKTCDIKGDLYVPTDASPQNRMPAVLSTNGFGGSKDDQAGLITLHARESLAAACFGFLPHRVRLDLAGWPEDIFSHS